MKEIEYEARLFPTREDAESALQRLAEIGYGKEQISLVLGERDLPPDQSFQSDSSPLATEGPMGTVGLGVGAAAGGIIGAIVGLAASTAMIVISEGAAIPFVAGPFVSALTGLSVGIASGGIVGALLEIGVEAEDWRTGLARGGVGLIVALQAHEDRAVVRDALMDWQRR